MQITSTSWPKVTLWAKDGLVALADTLCVDTDTHGSLWLPRGMRSDGASVPAPLWPVLATLDPSATPARLLFMGIVHDGAYRIDARWESGRFITRPDADDLARACAVFSGINKACADAIRYGLGVGAADHWHRKHLAWRPDI